MHTVGPKGLYEAILGALWDLVSNVISTLTGVIMK